jgi:hypothetical protein
MRNLSAGLLIAFLLSLLSTVGCGGSVGSEVELTDDELAAQEVEEENSETEDDAEAEGAADEKEEDEEEDEE